MLIGPVLGSADTRTMDRETAEDIKRHFDATVGGLRGEIVAVDEKLDRGFEELKRHFDAIAETLRSDIRIVAEGLVGTNDRLDRFEVSFSDRFGEMETMIRLSFGELARRIQG
jgi:hypothetical protein